MGCEVVKLWHKDSELPGFTTEDCIVLPGGFSYGDYLRSGAIARFSPIMQEVIKFAENGGKVLGICNGFQILCEAQLLPGALLRNNGQKFICKNVSLSTTTTNSLVSRNLKKDEVITIPIAHADGRFYADQKTLDQLKENDQILFQYCDEQGNISTDANPNGSLDNIAGICNANRNVFGMMPHPERAAEGILGNTDGIKILGSLIEKIMA